MFLAAAVDAYTLTADRIVAAVAVLVAVAGVIAGVRALTRPAGGAALTRPAGGQGLTRAAGGRARLVALAAGMASLVTGALVVVTADGGPGTGNGIVGGYLAVVAGLAAAVLGGLALARSRRPSAGSPEGRRAV